jgi:hypothetical protein
MDPAMVLIVSSRWLVTLFAAILSHPFQRVEAANYCESAGRFLRTSSSLGWKFVPSRYS